ncbi:MAG: glycosyltransferase [Acidimicrobiales bacterium]
MRYAGPSLDRLAIPVITRRGARSICAAYNEIVEEALADGADAICLIHDDVEICDERLVSKLGIIFADSSVGLVGVVGATGVTSIAWWQGDKRGRVAETRGLLDWGDGLHDVDAVDGLFLAAPKHVLQTVQFDEQRYAGFHGYDADFAFGVRAAGYRVIVVDLDVFHHTKGGFGDEVAYWRADIRWRQKWIPRRSVLHRTVRSCRYHAAPLEVGMRGIHRALRGWVKGTKDKSVDRG